MNTNNITPVHKTPRSSFPKDSSPQPGRTRTMATSCTQAKAAGRVRVKAMVLLSVAISSVAIFSTPRRAGASDVPVTLSPTSAGFGYVAIDTAGKPFTLTLRNYQSVALKITSITVSNTHFAKTGTTCGDALAAGTACTISVDMTPSTLTEETATLTVKSGAPAPYDALTSTLSGTGVADATLAPASYSFGNVAISTASSSGRFTLRNNEQRAMSILAIVLTGPNADDFSQKNTCGTPPAELAGGDSCTISVTLKPNALGTETATLMVTENAALAQYQTLTSSLSGTGIADVTLTPASASFGNVPLKTPSNPMTFSLRNNELVPVTISSVTLGNSDFAQTNSCGTSLPAQTSCTLSVTLTPSVVGTESTTLKVNDSAPAPYNLLSSSLIGTGTGPVDSLSPTSLTFGSQSIGTTSTAQTVTMTNSGNATLSITSLAITGTNAGDFAQTNTCGSSLAAGASCTVSVTFTPLASGSRTGSLTFTDNAANSPQTVSLSGTGNAPAATPAFSPAPGTYASAQTVTLSDTTSGASIYYTTNGTTPSTSYPVLRPHHRQFHRNHRGDRHRQRLFRQPRRLRYLHHHTPGRHTILLTLGGNLHLGPNRDPLRCHQRRLHLLHHQWDHPL